MDVVFSNTVFTNYLMGIPKETRDKVFLNMTQLKTVKFREAIRQIGGLTRVNIERLRPQELKKYRCNNSRNYKAKPSSKKKTHEKYHSNQENPTDSLVTSNSNNSIEEEHSTLDIESKDKESCLSLPESVETSVSTEDSISRIQEETELKPENKEEISVSSPESVLSLEIITCDNKKQTEETSSLIDKHSDKTKSQNSDLNTSQSQTTKESTSYKIDQNKVDINKDNTKINKRINTIPAHDKHKQKIINLFGDDEEIEIKIPSHKKTDTEEDTKSDTTDESNKMKKNSTCETNREKNIKMTQSLDKDNSTKTDVSKTDTTARRKSTHHREESNEGEKRTQSKSRDKSNVTETKLVRSSSKTKDSSEDYTARKKNTHHRKDINEEKSKSREKDISNDTKAGPSSSKLKDSREEIKSRRKCIHHREESNEKRKSRSNSLDKDISSSNDTKVVPSKTKDREEIKARRKSVHHREESKEKRKTRSKSRDRDVSNSTSVETISKTKDNGKEVIPRRKSIHHREESKDKEATTPLSESREKDSETSIVRRNDIPENVGNEKNKSKSQDSEKISSKLTQAKVARRQSIYQTNDSNEDNPKKEKNKPKSQDNEDTFSKSDKVRTKRDDKEDKRSKSHNKDELLSKTSSLKVLHKKSFEEKPINKNNALKIVSRRKTVSHPVPAEISSDTSSDSSSDGPIIIIRKKSSTKKDVSSESQTSKRRQSICNEPKFSSAPGNSRIRNSSDKIKEKAKEDKNDSSKTDNSGEEIKRSQSRLQEGKKPISCNVVSKPDKVLKKSSSSNDICKDNKKSDSNEKRRFSEVVSSTRDCSVSSTRSSDTQDKSSRSNTLDNRRKSTNQETSNSRSSSSTSINKTSSSKSNLSQDESPLDKRRKSISQETRNSSKNSSSVAVNKSSSSSKINPFSDESSSSNTSLIKRKKSADQAESPNSSRNSSKVRNVNRDSSTEKNIQQKSNTVVRCNEKSSSDKTSCKTNKSAEKNEKKNKGDKKKGCSSTPTRKKSVPVPEIVTDTSSDATVIADDLSNPQTSKRSKTSSELESDSSSDVNLDAVKRKIFSSIAVKASSLTRPTVAKDVKATTPKKSSITKEKSSTPKSSGVKDKSAPRKITKRRITVHQDNIEEEMERIFDASTPKRTRREKTSMRKRSVSICILPQCQEVENNGVKRKLTPVEVIDSSDDSVYFEVTSNKRTKLGETPITPTKNYFSYGDLEEQLKTTPSTSKTLDFVDPLSGSSSGFSKPNYDDDKTQDMTYDSVLIIEEKENTLPKILVRRRSVQDVEDTRERIISRRHSFHLDDIQLKEEPKDSDEEVNIARESTKQNTAVTGKDSSKPNIEPKRNILRRKSIHEISTQLQSPNDVRPIKSILKKRPSDSNETLPKRDSNVSNPSSARQVDLNDNNITSEASVPVRIDLQSIDIDKMFPTENTENAITLEISSEENSPTREEDSSKSILSIDSAISADSEIDKELEVRTNVSNPNDNQTSENLMKLKIELLDEIKFITTAQAVEAAKCNFVSLLYIYKQYFRMRVRVDCEKKLGKEPNLAVRMAYFSKRRDSDLRKIYEKLITFKVDNFIIETFFELIAKYLKEEFKEYREITEAVIYYFIQGIIWILTKNFTSPSDEKFLFNHITSCECVVYLIEKVDKYLINATNLDKKINAIFKNFTFKNSLDKVGTKQTETITRPSEIPSSTTVASSTVTQETVCSNTLKTITTESTTTKTCVEKTPPSNCCELMSSLTLDDCGQLIVPPSKSVWPPLNQQRKNLSLPIIETEDQTSFKPNPPPKRRGRPPKNLQNIQHKPAPKKTEELKATSTTNTRRPNILKPIVRKPVTHKPVPQKPPSPDFHGIISQINQRKSFLPSISKSPPPKVMISVSSEAYLPNTTTANTTQAVRKFVTYAITFDSKSGSQAGLSQQTIDEGLKNNTQSTKIIPQIIPCQSHDQNLSSDDDLHIVEEIEEQQIDKTSNSQLTNEIISLLQHPNQRTRSIEPPKQRIITVDGLIVPQSKAETGPPQNNQNISSPTLLVSAPVSTQMPAEVPFIVTSTQQATNQNITKSTTSVTTPFCTPSTFNKRTLSYNAKSALPPTLKNQNSSQIGPQSHGLVKVNNPTPQSTLTRMLNNLEPTNQEQNHPATLKSNYCQNNPYVQNHLRDQNEGQNKLPPNKSNPEQAIVGQNVLPLQKSVNLGHYNSSQKDPNPHSSNQVKSRPLYPNLLPQTMTNLTQNVTPSQLVPVSQSATLESNVNLGQNISSQNYGTPRHGQNSLLMGQKLPPASRDNQNLGQNYSLQNYETPNQRRNSSVGQNLPPTSRDNQNLGQNGSSQNYHTPNQRLNSSIGQKLPSTSRDIQNLGQNKSSQNYQTSAQGQHISMGQNMPLSSRDNVNDYSQNYQTFTQVQNTSMDQNVLLSSQGSVNLGQNNLSQNSPANQRQNRRIEEKSSSLVNVMTQNGSYMVQNNPSVLVSQRNQSNSSLTQNNNQSSIHTGSTASQNNVNVLMSQNNKNIPQQLKNHLNPNENDLTRLKTLARVAKSGSLREKNNTPPQKRKYNQNKSPQNNVNLGQNDQEMVRYGAHIPRNKNYEQVYQRYLHAETEKNNQFYQLMVQARQEITQNNLTMAQNVPTNSMGSIRQDVPLTYPHQMAMQFGMMPIHPNQMAQNNGRLSHLAQQMAPTSISHQYPYEMVPQVPMYKTQITHAIHEPVYNNLDFMRLNMTREAIAQHDYYDRMLSEMGRNVGILPSYEEYIQAQRLQNDINNGLHSSTTVEQVAQTRVFRQEMTQHLPQPFPAYSLNHQENQPRSELQPYQENHRRTQLNTLPQPFPSHNSNHSNMTEDNHSSKPKEVQRPSNSTHSNMAPEKYSSSSTNQTVSSNYVQHLQDMTDKQIPSLQVPSDPKKLKLIRPNLHEIELLKQNLEQIMANTPPVENTINRTNNTALSSTPGQQSYDMDSVHISEGPPQPRPIKWRMKKNLQQDRQRENSSAEENVPGNQTQVDVYNPALRNVSRDSGYFSPSDVAIQTLDVEGDVICDRCLAPSSLLCSGCYVIYYCSTECQQLAWPEHMKKCSELSPLQRR